MTFSSTEEIEVYFSQHAYAPEVHAAIDFLLSRTNDVQRNDFVGRVITDSYCNGFFGSRYDLEGSIILENSMDYITIEDTNGNPHTVYVEDGWAKRELSSLLEQWTK